MNLTTANAHAMGDRLTMARTDFVTTVAERGDLSRDQAEVAAALLLQIRAVKLDAVIGRAVISHGMYMDRDVLRRAAGIEA